MSDFRPIDQPARDTLHTELDTTFFVEASAGTGKTTALVDRIVALIASSRVEMPHLVAITFTDAAASDLRDRIRSELETAANDALRTEAERLRCANAAGDIDLAAIQTLHAFASTLLRSFPLEAGLPPDFEVLDAAGHGIAFDERFRRWLYGEVMEEDLDRRHALRRAFALGLTPAHLHDIAWAMQGVHDLVQPHATWATGVASSPITEAHRIGGDLVELKGCLKPAWVSGDHPTIAAALRAIELGEQLLAVADEIEATRTLQELFGNQKPSYSAGTAPSWPDKGAKENVKAIKDTIKAAHDQAKLCANAGCAEAFAECLPYLRDLTCTIVRERRERGQATFQDLLVWARDLLRDKPHIRRTAHATYQRVFVDEFQDTDPLQAEIAWYLTADPALANERDWTQLRPLPGRLFIVGDPKQSIYRFRGADIAIYDQIAELIQNDSKSVTLQQSFRSSHYVIDWVNDYFGVTMQQESGVQPAYGELLPRPHDRGFVSPIGGVYTIGEANADNATQRRQAEAKAIASVIRQMRGETWSILHNMKDGPTAGPARFSDMCILIRSRSNLSVLERALDQSDIPYRMESGSFVLETQVVREVISCLKAIDDPSDQVALVASLRSPAYGCSDVDLLDWVDGGGHLHFLEPGPGQEGPVRSALMSLELLHHARLDRSPAATIESLIHERLWAIQSFGERRPREMWRRLRWLVAQAHEFAIGENRSLRAFLDWMAEQSNRSQAVHESAVADADEDAVRIMTIHGSKGLEFPIVFLTDLGSAPSEKNGVAVIPVRSTMSIAARVNESFVTANFMDARSEGHAAAESHRLLYVASTRARDHLVLSLFRKASKTPSKTPSHADRIAQRLANGSAGLVQALTGIDKGNAWTEGTPHAQMPADCDPDEQAKEESVWRHERYSRMRRHSRSPSIAASSLAAHDIGEPDTDVEQDESSEAGAFLDRPGEWQGSIGRRRGLAVHAVMEQVRPGALETIGELSRGAADRFNLSANLADIERLARALVAIPAVQAGLSAPRMWREIPVNAPLGSSRVLECVIDLLFERVDGTLGIIDFKTDQVGETTIDQRAAGYRWQGAAYAAAIEHVTQRTVTSVELVFAAGAGHVIRIVGDDLRSFIGSIKTRIDDAD